VTNIGPVSPFGLKKKLFSKLTFKCVDHLLIKQINLTAKAK
jgi:hypothetical protein